MYAIYGNIYHQLLAYIPYMDPMGMNNGILKNQGDMDQFMDKDFEETDSWICRRIFEIFLIGSSRTKLGESAGVVD